jgi:predicted nucleotidyltransferase component of viral defense system
MKPKILNKIQISFLKEVKNNNFLVKNFYLTGATALAEFYLNHRFSEDLDFFTESEFDILNLNISFNQIKKKLKISKIDFQQSYNRNLFFLYFNNRILKTEFTFFPFKRIEKGKKEYSIEIDSLLDIAVNKLFTIYQRTKARDYIDLYCICYEKGFTIKELVDKAKIKFDWYIDPLQLATQFIKAKDTQDYPKMIKKIPVRKWKDFFIKEAKKLKNKIID